MSVVVTILTGRRPEYLKRTLSALEASLGIGLLSELDVICLVNGGDDRSSSIARGYAWVSTVYEADDFRSIGENVTSLAAKVRESRMPYWMHLEDDWAAEKSGRWLEGACAVLEVEENIGQVRLRHSSERVSASHLVTHRMIRWAPRPHFRRFCGVMYRVARAHATYNPCVMRSLDAVEWMSASSEASAMRKFHATGKMAAQVYPGVFRHIGTKSLRLEGTEKP